jgi:hypothetical protein
MIVPVEVSIVRNGFTHPVKIVSSTADIQTMYGDVTHIQNMFKCVKWCNDNVSGGWTSYDDTYYFKHEADALMFALVCG